MDERLWRIEDQRTHLLRNIDLPAVAKAIVGYQRGLVRLEQGFSRELGHVIFRGPGIDVVVYGADWALIYVKIADGTLDPPPLVFKDPRELNLASLDLEDKAYYDLVLGVLQEIFKDRVFPTSLL